MIMNKPKRGFNKPRVGRFLKLLTCYYRTRNRDWRPRKLTLDPKIACIKLYVVRN